MVSLPLLARSNEGALGVLLYGNGANVTEESAGNFDHSPILRIPQRALEPGEQYRFHFNMAQCIGCKCCVVACNEQNGNPPEVNWRRVGEIEGGWYPDTQRFYISMGCNHCLEPSCLIGCPVEAYKKDPITGIVQHSADACIGCQYCTWNCSYGVPQYNPERGVVGKCDMCYGRLADGREPACVNACPKGAIKIEIVRIDEWKHEYARSANAPGLPVADDSLSTTRITAPAGLPPEIKKGDFWCVKPEAAHWPLVAMTVLTQLSAGAFAAIWLAQLWGTPSRLGIAAVGSLAVGIMALAASVLHLGRPVYAYRAVKMWRRSWLSREVLLFGCFSLSAALYALSLGLNWRLSAQLGAITVLLGAGGTVASACIYRVRARPAWNTNHTIADFLLTAAILGPLFGLNIGAGMARLLIPASIAAASAQLLNQGLKLFRLMASDGFELQASAKLLSTILASRFLLRCALLVLGGIVLPLFSRGQIGIASAFIAAIMGEILGRYLFYVSVVPKNIASTYLVGEKAA